MTRPGHLLNQIENKSEAIFPSASEIESPGYLDYSKRGLVVDNHNFQSKLDAEFEYGEVVSRSV
jgi:hypothetical protein